MAEAVNRLLLVADDEERRAALAAAPERFYELVLQRVGVLEFVYHYMFELRPVLGRRAHDLRGVVYEVRYREKTFAAAELVPAGPAYGAGFAEQAVYPFFGLRRRFEQRERLLRFAAPFSERTPEKRFDSRFYLSARSGLQRHVEQALAEFCESFAVVWTDGARSPFFAEAGEPPLRVVRLLSAVEQPLRGERGENLAHPLLIYLCAQRGHRRGGGLER